MDFKKLSLSLLVSVAMVPHMSFALVGSETNTSHYVAVGELLDSQYNNIIQASVGEIGENTNTWTVTTLNDGFTVGNCQNPRLFANSAGDVIVLWVFTDSNGVAQLCASTLLAGESDWNSVNVSQSVGSAVFADGQVSINQAGDALIVWSAFDLITGATVILGSTTNIFEEDFEWSAPFVIAQP